jgi:E3 ubiquitin-protein ligase RNF13
VRRLVARDSAAPKQPLPFIALAKRGHCPFLDKFRAIQASGFAALIVGDDRREALVTMYAEGDTEGVDVAGVFVGSGSWAELRSFAMGETDPDVPDGDGKTAVRTMGVQGRENWDSVDTEPATSTTLTPRALKILLLPNPSPFDLLPLLLASISIPLITLGVLVFVGRYRTRRRRYAGVSKLPIVKYKRKGPIREAEEDEEPLLTGESEEDVCAICLDDFKEGEQVRMLRCGHGYHPNCVGGLSFAFSPIRARSC